MENKQIDNFNLQESMVVIGARLRSVRESLKMTQTQFSKIVKASQSKIAQCEIGSILVQSDVLVELYQSQKISPLWILMGEGERKLNIQTNNKPINFEAEVDRTFIKMHTLQMKEMLRRLKDLEIEVLLLKNGI